MKPKPNRNRNILQRTRMRCGEGKEAATAGWPSRRFDRVADPLQDVATDVETEVFHRSVIAALVHARADALLHRLADRPVLAVDEIPEPGGVAGLEVGLVDLEGLEQEMTGDVGVRGAARLQEEYRGMIAGEAQEQIRIQQLALVAHPLVFVQGRECAAARRARPGERIRAGAMHNAAQPVEIRAAALSERRHQLTQLRVHAPAVVALVVVLAEHLPVRGHLVADRMTDPQLTQGVARQALGNSAELPLQWHGNGWVQVQEQETAPLLDLRRVQAEEGHVELRLSAQIGCGDQPPVEVVGPLVIRTGDTAGGDATGEPGAGARGARLPAQARPTVPAYIVEGAQPSLAVAQQNDAFAEDIQHAERAGLQQLFLAPDTDPVAAEDPLLLHGEYALGAIPARWQGGLQTGQPWGRLMGAHGSPDPRWQRTPASPYRTARPGVHRAATSGPRGRHPVPEHTGGRCTRHAQSRPARAHPRCG